MRWARSTNYENYSIHQRDNSPFDLQGTELCHDAIGCHVAIGCLASAVWWLMKLWVLIAYESIDDKGVMS
jgi:hypothetical protein